MKRTIAALLLALGLVSQCPPAQASDMDATDGGGAAMPTILVTGYSLPGRTASGEAVGVGVAACPPWMAFGTLVHLSGKVELDVHCADRYAYWLSPRIDVWTRYSREAYGLTGMYYWRISNTEENES